MSSSIFVVQIIFPFIWPLHLYFPQLACLLIVPVIKFCCFPVFRLLNVKLLLLQSLFILLPFVLYSISCKRLWMPTLYTPQFTVSGSFYLEERLREAWRFSSPRARLTVLLHGLCCSRARRPLIMRQRGFSETSIITEKHTRLHAVEYFGTSSTRLC